MRRSWRAASTACASSMWREVRGGALALGCCSAAGRRLTRALLQSHARLLPCFLFPLRPGGLLDYDAIKDALFTGRVAGLGLDVQVRHRLPSLWLRALPPSLQR